jgi:hypothetical protein
MLRNTSIRPWKNAALLRSNARLSETKSCEPKSYGFVSSNFVSIGAVIATNFFHPSG